MIGWGFLLATIGASPNPTTVEEIAKALNELKQTLFYLDIWLNYQNQQFWTTLQFRLKQAQAQPSWFKTLTILSAYMEGLVEQREHDRKASHSQRTKLAADRLQAGDGLLNFARDLKEAVLTAEADIASS